MFLRNGWYTALWSNELKDRPIAKTLLNEKIVLFRNAGATSAHWRTAAVTAPHHSRSARLRAIISLAVTTGSSST